MTKCTHATFLYNVILLISNFEAIVCFVKPTMNRVITRIVIGSNLRNPFKIKYFSNIFPVKPFCDLRMIDELVQFCLNFDEILWNIVSILPLSLRTFITYTQQHRDYLRFQSDQSIQITLFNARTLIIIIVDIE